MEVWKLEEALSGRRTFQEEAQNERTHFFKKPEKLIWQKRWERNHQNDKRKTKKVFQKIKQNKRRNWAATEN